MATVTIVGAGEVGTAMANVLRPYHEVSLVGEEKEDLARSDLLGIAFPYSSKFIFEVKKYQDWYAKRLTVIFSTVPPGTCVELGVVHSPVVGIHPYLEEGIKTFTRFLGGPKAGEIEYVFRRAGLKTFLFDKAETTELMKIEDTTKYGLDIEHVKQVKLDCDNWGVPFEAWRIWCDDYNSGYQKLGRSEFTRPNLVPVMGELGGHCVKPNLEMLENKFTSFIKSLQV